MDKNSPEADLLFQKHYNKELRVSQDEVPIVLSELNDSALRYIQRDQHKKALILLEKAHGIINVISLENCKRDQYIAFAIFQNMAVCFQKMSQLDECSIALENALTYLGDYSSLKDQSIASRMDHIERECRIRLQLCALLSQLHRHKDALENAKTGVKMCHLLIKDLKALCLLYVKKQEAIDLFDDNNGDDDVFNAYHYGDSPTSQAASANRLGEAMSLHEKTSKKLLPVIERLVEILIKEQNIESCNEYGIKRESSDNEDIGFSDMDLEEEKEKKGEIDMRSVLGYLNQSEWISNINIGRLMQVPSIKISDFQVSKNNEVQLCR